jgi:voltage-gated potassium channel
MLFNKIGFNLDDFHTKFAQILNLFILGLIFISSGIFVAETFIISENISFWLNKIDLIILIIFTIEYIVRVWNAEHKLKFIFSLISLVDLIAIFPLFLGGIDVIFLRIFRVFRILRLLRFLEFEIFIFNINRQDGIILTRIFLTLFTLIFIASGLIYQFEHKVNPQVFRNFYDAFYFAIVTMTTVGFGDIAPISEEGRLVTLLMILTGVTIIPWQLGELIKQLVKNTPQNNTKICHHCNLTNHDADAIYCKLCGQKLTNQIKSIK